MMRYMVHHSNSFAMCFAMPYETQRRTYKNVMNVAHLRRDKCGNTPFHLRAPPSPPGTCMHTPSQGSRVRQATATATTAFVPLVIRCASNPHFLARVASARALAALVPATEAPDVISELLSRLPENEAGPAIAMSAGASAHNHIHGEKCINGTCQRTCFVGGVSRVHV